MGYDKTQVFDVTTEIADEPVQPLDEAVTLIKRTMESDRAYTAGLWFAYGRLHYEVGVLLDVDGNEDDEATAIGFALQVQQMMLDFHAGKRRDVVKMDVAWARFEASKGGTIESIGE